MKSEFVFRDDWDSVISGMTDIWLALFFVKAFGNIIVAAIINCKMM